MYINIILALFITLTQIYFLVASFTRIPRDERLKYVIISSISTIVSFLLLLRWVSKLF